MSYDREDVDEGRQHQRERRQRIRRETRWEILGIGKDLQVMTLLEDMPVELDDSMDIHVAQPVVAGGRGVLSQLLQVTTAHDPNME